MNNADPGSRLAGVVGPAGEECPACGEGRLEPWFVKDTGCGRFSILRCPRCRSAFAEPRPSGRDSESYYRSPSYKQKTVDEIRRNAQIYYPTSTMDADRIIRLCIKLTRGRRLLDIGAGFGEFSRAAKALGLRVTACEPNPNSRRVFLEVAGFEPEPDIFDEAYAKRYRAEIDVALASHILEHVPDPGTFVRDIGLILRPGGIGVISVPHFGSILSWLQGRKDMFISPPEHLSYFSRRGLARLLERSGFQSIVLFTASKINRKSLGEKFPWKLLGPLAWRAAYGILRLSDLFRRGTVIHAFFRKAGGKSR